ncbi:50S ribosomal protein L32 [Candidatus Wirthbacteria bacterium CG2_30_54_11]|uniref:Large ribosomal subunit protein bL32 n=1 Tax=Candidatus Wirthbacteria bacterium CG2_30_54_11 TaxID=1817892 RepID=A0A1J5IHP7_9BACT|nr:MAG: 50S ribosomal protein L32 [Candidatus Wirthbacteria bacterium CG2_30_54_11]
MAPLPKYKISKAAQGKHRSHLAIKAPGLSTCPKCGEKKLPHRVCPNCGTYKGEQVIAIKAKKAKK